MTVTMSMVLPACFQYAAIPVGAVRQGAELRVNLTEAGYTHLKDSVGDQLPRLRNRMEGVVVSMNDERLVLGVAISSDRPAAREMQQRIGVPLPDILGLERKSLDRKKTGIIVAGAAAALAVFTYHWISGEFGGTTQPAPETGPGEVIGVPFRSSR